MVLMLQEEVRKEVDQLNELRKEHNRYSKLTEIEKDKVKALIQQLEIAVGTRRWLKMVLDILIQFIIGLIFFVVGWLVAGASK